MKFSTGQEREMISRRFFIISANRPPTIKHHWHAATISAVFFGAFMDGSASAQTYWPDKCGNYAATAVANQSTNLEQRCYLTGDDWNSQQSFHFSICMELRDRYLRVLVRQEKALSACAQRIRRTKNWTLIEPPPVAK